MTDDSIRVKALALLNEVLTERGLAYRYTECDRSHASEEALCRAIERHETYKQKVSDAIENEWANLHYGAQRNLSHLIIFKSKPDPLVDVFDECFNQVVREGETWSESMARKTRAALKSRNLKIVEA